MAIKKNRRRLGIGSKLFEEEKKTDDNDERSGLILKDEDAERGRYPQAAVVQEGGGQKQQRRRIKKTRKQKRSRRNFNWSLTMRRILLRSQIFFRRSTRCEVPNTATAASSKNSLWVTIFTTLMFLFILQPNLIFHHRRVPSGNLQSASSATIMVSEEVSLEDTSSSFQQLYRERNAIVDQNTKLYDTIYKLSSERLLPPDETEWPEYTRSAYALKSSYGPAVEKCDVTIVVTDPRLAFPKYLGGPGQPIWFALESIGAYANTSCVVLQTSCAMEEYLGDEDTPLDEVTKEITQSIYGNSLPLFRKMIENGYVRLTILDHKKYNLKGCTDYGNPSPAYMNRRFWEDEFVDGVDSDLVMIVQGDTALCYPLDITDLDQYAFVGGLWPKKATPLTPEPMEGSCLGMPSRWSNWLLPQRRWRMQQQRQQQEEDLKSSNSNPKPAKPVPEPKEILSEDFPSVCEHGRGPLGNGGFSLRSRRWMIRAIETCPHVAHSGIDLDDQPPLACKVFEQVNEDFYFGTILSGIDAPLPNAYEASLFATEMLWPEQVWDMYGLPTQKGQNHGGGAGGSVVAQQQPPEGLRGETNVRVPSGKPFVWFEHRKLTIPNGVHKPWWYHSNDLIRSNQVTKGCRFLPYIFTPDMSRFEELNKDVKPWVGVGK